MTVGNIHENLGFEQVLMLLVSALFKLIDNVPVKILLFSKHLSSAKRQQPQKSTMYNKLLTKA